MTRPFTPRPNRTLARARVNNRARARGAVMVEAALVLPLLVVFLGLNVFFHRAYKAKIRVRSEAREAAFESASRACPSGTNATESSMQTGTGAAAGGTDLGQTAAKKGDGTSAVMSFDHGTAKASKSATVSWKTAYGPWEKTLKPAESFVYCNEKGVATNAASWFSWGTSEFKNR